MTLPLISCIIPCYNRPEYVRVAIDSALEQTYRPIEVIVVDDGSTDLTPQVLEAYGERIRTVHQANSGTAAARNAGIAAAKGEYLAWLDSDDAWLPQKIAEQVAVALRHPGSALVYTSCQGIDRHGNPPLSVGPIPVPVERERTDILRMLVVESEVMPSSCLVHRGAIEAVGGFEPETLWEDWELHLRLGLRVPFFQIDAPLTRYRVHDQSKTKDRWLHARGMLQLRHKIEAMRPEALARDPSSAMIAAYKRHRVKYAQAYYRVGKIATSRGEVALGRDALRSALKLYPFEMRFYTRYLQACLARPARELEQTQCP